MGNTTHQSLNSKRRHFLKSSLVGLGGVVLLPNTNFAQHRDTVVKPRQDFYGSSVFIIESGIIGKDPLSLLALMVVEKNAREHEDVLAAFREHLSYRTKLTYASNDEYKVPFAKRVIAYFNACPDLKLFLKPVSRFENNISPAKSTGKKLQFYQELFARSGLDTKGLVVNSKSQSPYGPNSFFIDSFSKKTEGAILKASSAYDSNLLQMASFITGTIMLDFRGGVKESSVKHRLLAELKAATLNYKTHCQVT